MNKKTNWESDRKKLKLEYQEKGIIRCEACLDDCMKDFALSFHHRHKRIWYLSRPKLLGDFNQTILVCASCHYKLEGSRALTLLTFNKLRYNENL